MTRKPWFRLVALGAVCDFAALACVSIWTICQSLLILSGIFYFFAIVAYVIEKRQRDPYSLDTLREMMNEGTYQEEDIPEVDDDGDKYCLNCHHVYGAHFGVCPKCGR